MEPLKERIAIKALHPKLQEVDRELLARVDGLGASLRPTGRALGAPAPEPLRQARVQQRRRQPQRLIEQIQVSVAPTAIVLIFRSYMSWPTMTVMVRTMRRSQSQGNGKLSPRPQELHA